MTYMSTVVSPLDQYQTSGPPYPGLIMVSCDDTACDTEFAMYHSIYFKNVTFESFLKAVVKVLLISFYASLLFHFSFVADVLHL